jgi:hypothetical protein
MAKRKTPGTQLQTVPAKTELEPWQETMEEHRGQIWQNANGAFREKLSQMQNWFDREARASIKARWELGNLIKEIEDDCVNHQGRRYGIHAIEEISRFFGWDKTVIYNSLRLAKEYAEEEIDELCERRLPDGQLLSYSHLMSVITLRREERKKLIDRAVEESWTSDQLARVVIKGKESGNSQKDDKRGRPIGKPRTFDLVLAQMEAFADDFMGRAVVVWDSEEHSLDAKARDFAMEDWTPERAQNLKTVAEKLQKVSEMSKKLAEQTLDIREMFLKHKKVDDSSMKTVGTAETDQDTDDDESEPNHDE